MMVVLNQGAAFSIIFHFRVGLLCISAAVPAI
jgi:hypothetical protein